MSPRTPSTKFFLLWALVLSAAGARPALAQTPREKLLRLVPDNVGLCLVIDDLRGHGQALLQSPFFKKFAPAFANLVTGAETAQVDVVDQWLQNTLHVSALQLRDDVLGDALVFAYRPGPIDKPDREQGLFLIHARDAKLLSSLVDRLNELQREAGDLKELKERTCHGRMYYRRQDARDTNFYFLDDHVLAFSPKEEILLEVIEQDSRGPNQPECKVAHEFRHLPQKNALATLWLNPRVYDDFLQQKIANAAGEQALALKTFLGYWRALDGFALQAELDEDARLSLLARYRPEALPPAARRLAGRSTAAPAVWNFMPSNAMFAAGGSLELPGLLDAICEFLSEESRKNLREAIERSVGTVLGKNVAQTLLPSLGPDWAVCVFGRGIPSISPLPEAMAALRVRPGKDGSSPLLALNTLHVLTTLLVLQTNGFQPGALQIKLEDQDGVEVHYLVNDEHFPPQFKPAYAFKHGYLLMATSPGVLRQFAPTNAARPSNELLGHPLLKIAFREVRDFLKDHRQAIVDFVAARKGLSADEIGQQFDRLLGFLELVDTCEVRAAFAPGQLSITLCLRPPESLR
jgi:hypothetical protein